MLVGVAVIALPPAAVQILSRSQPIDRAPHGGIIRADAGLRECGQDRPGAVNIVGPPATEPRAIAFLLVAQVSHRALERRSVLRTADARERCYDPGGNVARRRIQQRAMIGERDRVQIVTGVVRIERAKSAVAALHADEPVKGTPHAVCIAGRVARLMHRPNDDCRIVKIGVIAVRELERPAPARQIRSTHAPVAGFIEELSRLQPVEC